MSIQATQGSFVVIDGHTPNRKLLWNGQEVSGVKAISLTNNDEGQRVVVTVAEDPLLAEMAAAGIIIRRALP